MLTIFASNQEHHAFGVNYERAVVKKTEIPSRLAHTKKWGNNSSTQPFRLNMTCFVVANCVEKFNNEIKGGSINYRRKVFCILDSLRFVILRSLFI